MSIISLLRISEVEARGPSADLPIQLELATARQIRKQIGSPRPGAPPGAHAMCPFVPEALTRDTLRLGALRTTSKDTIIPAMLEFRADFLDLERGENRIYTAAAVIMPDLLGLHQLTLAGLKTELAVDESGYLAAGLMIGAFVFPFRHQGGEMLLPLFVVRHMVREDSRMIQAGDDPREMGAAQQKYLELFGE